MGIKEKMASITADIPAVFMALKDDGTPFAAKLLAGLTIMYALSPIDLIPDFVPVLGYLDDVIILPLMVSLTVKSIPAEVLARCREKAAGLWQQGKPQKWYYAIPVVLVWLIILWIVVKVIFY